jgi:hypothetical protein
MTQARMNRQADAAQAKLYQHTNPGETYSASVFLTAYAYRYGNCPLAARNALIREVAPWEARGMASPVYPVRKGLLRRHAFQVRVSGSMSQADMGACLDCARRLYNA